MMNWGDHTPMGRIGIGHIKRFWRCEKGLAALEFVMVAPILLMLVFGIIIYSLYFASWMAVRQAAGEGARAAMAALSPDERDRLALERANDVIASYGSLLGVGSGHTATALAGATVSGCPGSSGGNNSYTVSVQYDMSSSPLWNYGLLPKALQQISSCVLITNGSY